MADHTPAALPDQPEDWTEPGAHEVAPGVHRIPLPMPFDALRAVNVYVVRDAGDDDDETLLIDSGWDIPATSAAFRKGLAPLGLEPGDVRRFAITHAHHDHYSAALALQRRLGCEVAVGRGERPSIEAYPQRYFDASAEIVVRGGAPELAATYRRARRAECADDTSAWGLPDWWLDDGQRLDVGSRQIEVRATPGHTRGHVVFRDVAAGLLFSGDHVLPHITPSIGYEAAPEPMPLRSYLDSLRIIRDLPDALLLPAHGPVTASAHTRVHELLVHHDDRLVAMHGRVIAGDATAFEVASALPWTRRGRSFAGLELQHRALAVMETMAHLDVLVEAGRLVRTVAEGGVAIHRAPPA